MFRPILDWFRGQKSDGVQVAEAGNELRATAHGSSLPDAADEDFVPQVLMQGGLADLKRVANTFRQHSIDSQIIVPPSGCNS